MSEHRASDRQVVVIGGGLAGISAALQAADGGVDVTLIERRPRLGGRTWSFNHHGLRMDNGQHVFMRCCTAYRAFLERIDATALVNLQARLDVPVVAPGGRQSRIRRNRLPAPLHLGGVLARYQHLSVADRVRLGPAVARLSRLDPDDPALDECTFGSWLSRHGQSARSVVALWDLIARPTLNLLADEAALGLAVRVFRTGLLDSNSAGDLGWSRVPLGELHGERTEKALIDADVHVMTTTSVGRIQQNGDAWSIGLSAGRSIGAHSVILAVPHGRAASLLPEGSIEHGGELEELGASPIVNVHLVYDRRVTDLAFAAAIDSPVQFVFDRSEGSGLRGEGQYLAISLSAADSYLATRPAELVATMSEAVRALFPRAVNARLVDALVTREPMATFRAVPGTRALRPPATTMRPGLFLAGAWTNTGWPDTMESAVRSGVEAADRALELLSGDRRTKEIT